MAFRYSIEVRNDGLDQRVRTIGPSPILRIFDRPQPENCELSDPAPPLVEMTLPHDWMAGAEDAVISKIGTWSAVAIGGGEAMSYRIYDKDGEICHMQGDVSLEEESGSMALDNAIVTIGKLVKVKDFSIYAGNG